MVEIRKLMAADGFDTTQKLRVGVKGGGCSGMTYVLGFDHKEEADQEFDINGIACIMNKYISCALFIMQALPSI